jgi:C-terminal processing protease CtpA/Prc
MIWAEWRDGSALVTGVQPGSNAAKAGVMPGDIVLRLDGRDAGTAMPDGATPQLLNHVLLQELAGRRGASVTLELLSPNGAKRSITLSADCAVDRPASPLSAARTPRGYGLIRFNNSLGDTATVSAFDQVLNGMKEAPGLIVDLRDTPSGGNSTVGRGFRWVKASNCSWNVPRSAEWFSRNCYAKSDSRQRQHSGRADLSCQRCAET